MCININNTDTILLHHKLLEWTSLFLTFQDSASPHSDQQCLPVRGSYLSSPGWRAENTSVPCPVASQNSLGQPHWWFKHCAEGWKATQPISSAVPLMDALKQVGEVKFQVILAACKNRWVWVLLGSHSTGHGQGCFPALQMCFLSKQIEVTRPQI